MATASDLAALLRRARCAGDDRLADALALGLQAVDRLPLAERTLRTLRALLGIERG